ncbi:transmembrane protein [Citrus sinensis]|uniref:Transmembrane protein n=1 Tax=Citrus sinensis TaxID=2711 RepID=A0ACB8I261_CITSI|nr:transmembrane protein [Citrus sinensis]
MFELAEVSVESSSAGFKIRRVPEHLRTENVRAYEPQIITIGPLNHHLRRKKTHLAEMQKHKVLYLKKLPQRRGEDLSNLLQRRVEDLSNLVRYWVTMRELEKRARCCYAEPIEMSKGYVASMLLLDACFIVEIFRKFKLDLWDDDDNVFWTSWVRQKLGRDLLLADNQLPLFVLQEFYDITKMPEDEETNFQDLILGFFSKVVLLVQLLKVAKIGPF